MNFDNVFLINKQGVLGHLKEKGLHNTTTYEKVAEYSNYLRDRDQYSVEPVEEYNDPDYLTISKNKASDHVAKLNNDLMYIYTDLDAKNVILCGVIKMGEGEIND